MRAFTVVVVEQPKRHVIYLGTRARRGRRTDDADHLLWCSLGWATAPSQATPETAPPAAPARGRSAISAPASHAARHANAAATCPTHGRSPSAHGMRHATSRGCGESQRASLRCQSLSVDRQLRRRRRGVMRCPRKARVREHDAATARRRCTLATARWATPVFWRARAACARADPAVSAARAARSSRGLQRITTAHGMRIALWTTCDGRQKRRWTM